MREPAGEIMATIDYYMTSLSPWTYLGHAAIRELAARHGARLVIKPVQLPDVFENAGALPLAKRSPARQRYRFIELQRYAVHRGLAMNFKPKFFPVDPTLADHAIIALAGAGGDALDFAGRVLAAVWAEDRDIADENVLAACLKEAGHDATAILKAAATPEVAEIRKRNTAEAIAIDAMGAPVYALNGEPFWGQDRIELLGEALQSGRASFRPL
jgi:2-hydroxychromene-2-carboxylate isomerase